MIGLDTNILARYYIEDEADVLHHASYRTCQTMLTFDDRKFARRAARLALMPNVKVPK